MRPVNPWAAIDTLPWVIQSCSTAPAFSVLQHSVSSPAPHAQGCLWMGSDSAETSCTSVASGVSGVVISSMQPLPQLNSLLLCLRYRYMSKDHDSFRKLCDLETFFTIQVRMWVHGSSSWVSESSPEWQMNHFTWPGSRWFVLDGEGICAACFLDLAQLFIFHRTNTKICVDYRAAATEICWDVVSAIITYNSWHLPQSHSVAVPCWYIWLMSLWALHKSITHQWNTFICGI